MKILEKYISAEFSVKGSRFLSELFPCSKQEEARALIKSQKAKYADATHVVHAFILGLKAEIMGMSDDGEPSGTAGRPALDVLKGHESTNHLLTITRWFGGTLLGTGGLVKAYGDGAKQVLLAADQAGLFCEYIEKKSFVFNCDYQFYQVAKHIMEQYSICNLNETFEAEICINGELPLSEYQLFFEQLKNSSNGKIILKD